MRDLTKKYRPNDWLMIVGQDALVKTLKSEIETDEIQHAYLFCGPRGTGKTTTARVFSKNIDATVIEMDAASNSGVDNIRDLRQDVQFLPTDGKKYKVYIIDEVHMLSTSAQAGFLKVLEEPPAHVIFILATTDPQKLSLPVLSRCQRFNLNRIANDDIIKNVSYIATEENIKIEYDALEYIAKSVDGGMRDAIKLLQKCSSLDETITVQTVVDALGSVNVSHLEKVTNLLLAKDIKETLIYFRDLISNGVDIKIFLADMVQYLTDLMSNSIINDNYDISEYMQLLDSLIELLYGLRNSTQLKVLSEIKFIKMCSSNTNFTQPVTFAPKVEINTSGSETGRTQPEVENKSADPQNIPENPNPDQVPDALTYKIVMEKLTTMEKKMIDRFVGNEMIIDGLQRRR